MNEAGELKKIFKKGDWGAGGGVEGGGAGGVEVGTWRGRGVTSSRYSSVQRCKRCPKLNELERSRGAESGQGRRRAGGGGVVVAEGVTGVGG